MSEQDQHASFNIRSIGEQLRAARETRKRSIADVAASTRINRQFLEQIERGVAPKLPETYLRGLIRTYAREIGLDPDVLLRGEETPLTRPAPPGTDDPVTVTVPRLPGGPVPAHSPGMSQGRILGIMILIVATGMVALLFWMRQGKESTAAREISFSDAVKEQEARIGEARRKSDSAGPMMTTRTANPLRDSLDLEAVATDSVSIRLTIDGGKTIEKVFAPKASARWKANRSFLLSASNAAAISFTLNGRKIGYLSLMKKPVRNVTLSWETLRKAR